jgi:hypothetical protein
MFSHTVTFHTHNDKRHLPTCQPPGSRWETGGNLVGQHTPPCRVLMGQNCQLPTLLRRSSPTPECCQLATQVWEQLAPQFGSHGSQKCQRWVPWYPNHQRPQPGGLVELSTCYGVALRPPRHNATLYARPAAPTWSKARSAGTGGGLVEGQQVVGALSPIGDTRPVNLCVNTPVKYSVDNGSHSCYTAFRCEVLREPKQEG